MKNSKISDRVWFTLAAVLSLIAAISMLVLEESSLVSDLVYAGF
ncbi:MAG TPA: hypothetical protein VM146_03865 [Steroidobacteraceae bacterium]|nr:hypothetical protein [Steroidobacteraceae bacterium]